jgi:hypothetical protein
VNLGIDISIEFVWPNVEQFNSYVDGLRQSIVDANFDWTGTLTLAMPIWIELNKENAFELVNDTFQNHTNPLQFLIDAGLAVLESPRKTWSHGE